MARMPDHEFLINTMASTALIIIPAPFSPIAPSGILKSKFGYDVRLPEFGEAIEELAKKKGAKLPDLLLVNTKKKLLITVECKSDFTFKIEETLAKQIEFYSSKTYKQICSEMFPDLVNHEIWIFSPENLCTEISKFVGNQVTIKNPTNIVVWGLNLKKRGEEAHIRKFYGNHLDSELNQKMDEGGFSCSPPRFELLIDPTLSYGKRICRIGRRILASLASLYISEKDRIISLQSFKEKHKDVTMTDKELRNCFRYLSKLIPEIGAYKSGTGELILAKRPSLDKIKAKLLEIQDMTNEEIKVRLAKIGKVGIREPKRPRGSQETKISDFFPKKKIMNGFIPVFKPNIIKEKLIGPFILSIPQSY